VSSRITQNKKSYFITFERKFSLLLLPLKNVAPASALLHYLDHFCSKSNQF